MKHPFYFLLLFAILFLFSCNPREPKKIPPKAVKGVLDVRQWVGDPLSNTFDPINIDGEWEFYWNEFVPPEDAPILNSNLSIQNPKSKIQNLKYITVPSQWQNHGYSSDGYATYRLRILLPDYNSNFANQSTNTEKTAFKIHNSKLKIPLSISMTDTGTAYEMYINGKLASVNGKVGKSKEESEPFFRYYLFSIDEFVETHSRASLQGEIEILIHVSNYHHFKAGLWDKIRIGSSVRIEKEAKQKFALDLVVFSSLLIMALYHLGLFLNRRKDLSSFYFTALCFSFAIRIVSINERIILDVFPDLPFFLLLKLEYLSLYLGSYLFVSFIKSLFPEEFSRRVYQIISTISIFCSLIVVLFPMSLFTRTLIVVQITILIGTLHIYKVSISAILHKRLGAKLFLVGFVLFMFAFVNDILKSMSILGTPMLASYGLLTMVISQAIILSRRFAGGFEEAEILRDDLQVLAKSLESKISDGVREKQKYNQYLLELSKSKTKELSGLLSALREITESCSKILQVDRVSIWKLDQVKDELNCIDLFIARENKHEKNMRFINSKFPKYFQYLKEEDVLSAVNVYSHAGIMEFNEDYHAIFKIQSALDSPIRSGGSVIGVISCEKIEIEKAWTTDEENFVSSLANILASLFESEERQQAYIELAETKKEIEEINSFSHLVNSLSDLNSIFTEISKYFYHKFGISSVWLFLPDEKREYLFAYKVYSYHKLPADKYDYMMNKKIPLKENEGGMMYKNFQRKKPLYLSKIPKFEFGIDKELVETLSLISFLQVPLVRKEECVGIVSFSNLEKEMKLSKKEINTITNLCSQIAGAIDTNHLLQEVEKAKIQSDAARIEAEIERGISVIAKMEVEKAKQKTEGLNQLIKKVNEASNLEKIMDIILSYVKDNYNLPYYSLFTLDPKGEFLKFANAVFPDYVTSEHKKIFSSNVLSVVNQNMDSIHSRALALKSPIFIPDAETEIKTENGKVLLKILKHKSFLTLPIILQNNPIGTLDFFSIESLRLREEEITELSLLAEQLAGLIHGVLLLTQVQEEKEKALLAQRDTEKQKQETEDLNMLIKSLNEDLDIKIIMQKLHAYIKENYNINYYGLAVVDKLKEFAITIDDLSPDFIPNADRGRISRFSTRVKDVVGAHAHAFKSKRPFYAPRIRKSGMTKEEIFNQETTRLESILIIPLILQNEPIGFLDLYNVGKMELSKDDITKLSILGEQLAGIIHGSNLLKQIQEEKEKALVAQEEAEKAQSQIEFLNEFSKVINSFNNLDIIFSHAVENLSKKIDTDMYQLHLIDKTKNELFIRCSSGTDSNLIKKYQNIRVPLTPESGSVYLTYTSKKILYLKNTKKIPGYKKTEFDKMSEMDFQISSVLQIPLLVNEEVIGIMHINKFGGMKKLSKDEIRFVESLCEQLALAVNNSFLLEETERARQESDNLNALMKNVNSVSSLVDIMTFIMFYLETEYNFSDFSLLLKDNEKERIIPFSFTSARISNEQRNSFMERNIPFENLSGIFKDILENKQLTFVEKENIADDDIIAMEWIKEGEFDYLLFVPLVIYDELIGVLFLHSPKKEMTITKEKLDKLGRFAELIAGSVFNAQLLKKVEESKEQAEIAQKESEIERQKSEKLLLNILPKDVAAELKEKGFAEPVLFENVSVMFTDFKGFTTIAETLTPQELIKDLDACFVQFDKISERFNLEKLKTIGDSYMCAGGIPKRNKTHAIDCCLAALEIQTFMNLMKRLKEEKGFPYWELRLGIHTGPLIAGVIGERKFAYDVWGDTVNTASRMESSGTPGKINISYSTYEVVKDYFVCEYRGEVSAKNKGVVKMYYLERIKPEFSKDDEGLMPNGKFWEVYG